MDLQIIDIASDGCFLRKYRGHIRLEQEGRQTGTVTRSDMPIDEIEAVIVHGRHGGYSHESLLSLGEHGIPVVLCDANHRPRSWFWPLDGHFEQTRRMAAQLTAKKGLKNRLWAHIVKEKIRHQGMVLARTGCRAGRFDDWAKRVKSGDVANLEGQVAAVYWPTLFGQDFIRDAGQAGVNAQLNYGYTILRASVARQLMAAGMHLSIGLFHRNRFNAWCLADDMMEPFRPLVDYTVWRNTIGRGLSLQDVSSDLDLDLDLDTRLALVEILAGTVGDVNGLYHGGTGH